MFDHLLLLFPQKIVYLLPKVIMVITAEKDKVYLSENFAKIFIFNLKYTL